MNEELCEWPACVCKKVSWVYDLGKPPRLIWFEVPRACSTTIKEMFKKEKNKHRKSRKSFPHLTFGVVRNPWDRVVSNWMLWHGARKSALKQMAQHHGRKVRIATFPMFVDFIMEYDNHHWAPCSEYVRGAEEFIRYERFEKDFAALLEEHGLGRPVIHMNKSHKRKPYQAYYTQREIDIVAKMYAEDIERYCYEF